MANNCWNHARIKGNKSALDEIENRISDSTDAADYGGNRNFWWESFKEFFKGMEYDFTSNNVYKEFGSKWFVCNVERWSDTELILSGDSANSPVCSFLEKISESFYVSVEHTYEEQGTGFGGWFECSNGEVTRDEQVSYIEFIDTEDPGRAFEEIFFTVEDGIFKNEEDVKESYGKDYDLLTEDQKNRIREFFNTKKKI
jgi:hypothetical protein